MARIRRNSTLRRGFRSPENTPPFQLPNWRFQGKTLAAPQGPTTPSRPPCDPAEEFLEALKSAVNLLNEIDPRNFTKEERKWMADTVTKLIGVIELEGTTATSTPTDPQETAGERPG